MVKNSFKKKWLLSVGLFVLSERLFAGEIISSNETWQEKLAKGTSSSVGPGGIRVGTGFGSGFGSDRGTHPVVDWDQIAAETLGTLTLPGSISRGGVGL
ncbi:MAG: hypothetical protein EOP04_02750 [Proteobacteria bacterium]|nr:MAG: hypothetical protein EOP04_02750 [Pseudomonadota bacterium]